MKTVKVFGAGMADEIFATDPKIYGEELCWNVTRLRRDAVAGRFGKAYHRAVAILPPMTGDHSANIEWDIVNAMLASHKAAGDKSILLEPSIVITVRIKDELHRIIADGNKRVCARRLAGFGTWDAFIVPPDIEAEYRVVIDMGEGTH